MSETIAAKPTGLRNDGADFCSCVTLYLGLLVIRKGLEMCHDFSPALAHPVRPSESTETDARSLISTIG
jgi:hypothetical protein